jgi:hypothetical protein
MISATETAGNDALKGNTKSNRLPTGQPFVYLPFAPPFDKVNLLLTYNRKRP